MSPAWSMMAARSAAGRAAQERFFARLTRGLEPEEIRSVERGLARMARNLEEMPF